MRLISCSGGRAVQTLFLAWIVAGCSGGSTPASGSRGGEGGDSNGGESGSGGGGSGGGAGGVGGSGGGVGGGGSVSRDASPAPEADADSEPTPDAESGSTPDAESGSTPDVTTGPARDGGAVVDSGTPMTVPGQPTPSYDGQIPIYYGPDPGPVVQMNCPGDPTAGWKEYQESFHVEHPYTLPTNKRFSITGGIYNFWVFPNDAPHSPTAQGRNPRTEANYGGTYDKTPGSPGSDGNGHFTSGQRLYSADMLIEPNAIGSAIMQIHTTATGGGPIGIRMQSNGDIINNGSLKVVDGSSVPGGIVNKWFNYKASLDTATMEVKIYINNCLKSTYTGQRGSGAFYFKNGVYFCKTSQNGCFSHYKNIHLYKK
jgi:hypothetical protein